MWFRGGCWCCSNTARALWQHVCMGSRMVGARAERHVWVVLPRVVMCDPDGLLSWLLLWLCCSCWLQKCCPRAVALLRTWFRCRVLLCVCKAEEGSVCCVWSCPRHCCCCCSCSTVAAAQAGLRDNARWACVCIVHPPPHTHICPAVETGCQCNTRAHTYQHVSRATCWAAAAARESFFQAAPHTLHTISCCRWAVCRPHMWLLLCLLGLLVVAFVGASVCL